MKKSLFSVTSIATAASVLLVGYLFFSSIPDLRRYM
jgi:hypothetical protein